MKITLLCNDEQHPVNGRLQAWIASQEGKHEVELIRSKAELSGGDILFLISCSQILSKEERRAYREVLVLHASDLPEGRGWSPHIWRIIDGAEEITVSLLEAEDGLDSGAIWKKIRIDIPKHALWDEINALLFDAEIKLIDFAVRVFDDISPVPQDTKIAPTYYLQRTPADSELDPSKSISSQFDRIRVCDPDRFPAFFKLHGKRFKLVLEKIDE